MAKFGCPVALIASLVVGSSGCLLYTEEINHPPAVKAMGPATRLWGETAVYTAEPSDPDESPGTLKVEWRMAVTCPVTVEAARMGTLVGDGPVVTFDTHLAPADDFCMFVVVSDKNQAAALAKVPTKLTHQDVQAVIDVVKPTSQPGDRYELFSTLQISGARSKDPETDKKVTLRWSLTHNAEPHALGPCPEGGDTERCFTASTPGEYRLELVASSERGVDATVTKVLTVEPDRPPCIGQTDPAFELHKIVRDAADEFKVRVISVDDDGDPLPEIPGRPSNYRFVATWWRAGDNGPPVRRPAELERYDTVPFRKDYFQPGDEVFVRVQINDRVDRDNDFAECIRTNAENCALTKRPGCFQWVTWKVRFI